jgi:hypothetical protein
VSKWGDISAVLTLRQYKHVLMASRDKGAQQKSGHKAIGFISQIFGSKTHQKSKQNVGKMK